MKMKFLILISFIIFLVKSCSDKDSQPTESFKTINIAVKQGEIVEYDTKIDNFLGAVKVVDSTNHHAVSELFVDSTDFNIFHRYKPKDNFKGKDTLVLRSERINDTSDEIISIKNVTAIFTVD